MMHPSCLLKVEEKLAQEKNAILVNVIRNLCANYSDSLRMKDLKLATKEFESDIPKDCRLKKLLFHDFRTYPSNDGHDRYGLSFQNKFKTISSFLFLGKNGSGKSTLYNALQKIYLGYSDYAAKINQEENRYLTFGFGNDKIKKEKSWTLSYLLASDKEDFRITNASKFETLAVPAFFCSDVDVDELKVSGNNIFHWVLKQMGYEHLDSCIDKIDKLLHNLNSQLDSLTDGKSLSYSEYNSLFLAVLNYEESDLQEIENGQREDLKHIQEPHLFKEIWSKIKHSESKEKYEGGFVLSIPVSSGQQQESLASDDTQNKILIRLYQKLYQLVKGREGNDWKLNVLFSLKDEQRLTTQDNGDDNSNEEQLIQNITLLNDAKRFFCNLQGELIKTFIDTYGEGILQILSFYSCHNEKFSFDYKEDLQALKVNIHVSLKGNYDAEPRDYFNEFRFKLYCVTIKTAICFNWMLENRISLPIVIDDVFNASDFENSLKLEHFAYSLKLSYNEHVLLNGFLIPLQFIMMSHDDLVVNAFLRGYQGICCSDIAKLKETYFPICTARIYRLEEIDEYYSLVENSETFKNIYQYV